MWVFSCEVGQRVLTSERNIIPGKLAARFHAGQSQSNPPLIPADITAVVAST